MLKVVYALLAALKACTRLTQDDIRETVSRVKDAWLKAFEDVDLYKGFAGEHLSDQVSIMEIGVIAARERLKALMQKIGGLKTEIQQLWSLDYLPTGVKSKLGEALRTSDATPLIRAHGWEGWLNFALAYRSVTVLTDPDITVQCKKCKGTGNYGDQPCPECGGKGVFHTTMMRYYNKNSVCAKCAGTGSRSMRVKLKKPKKVKLNADAEYEVTGLKNGRPIVTKTTQQRYEYITHVTKKRKCACCKGTGVYNKNTKRFPLPYDLIDVLEMVGIMQALYIHTNGEEGGVMGHISKEQDEQYVKCGFCCTRPKYGVGMGQSTDFHESMFHNAEMDFFDREHEAGGDINTNPQDRTFQMDRERDQAIDDRVVYEEDAEVKLGTMPKFYTVGGVYRGPMRLSNLRPAQWKRCECEDGCPKCGGRGYIFVCTYRSIDRDYQAYELGPLYKKVEAIFTKYPNGYGEFQRYILDRIYNRAFAWSPEFYWFRNTKKRMNYLTGKFEAQKRSNLWARVVIRIDDEIGECLADNVRDDVKLIEVNLTGAMAQVLYNESNCPVPEATLIFEKYVESTRTQYNVPVAHMSSDGQWHTSPYIKEGFRRSINGWIKKVKVDTDQTGEKFGRNLPDGYKVVGAKKRNFVKRERD